MSAPELLTIDRRDIEHACCRFMCRGVDEFLDEVERSRMERELKDISAQVRNLCAANDRDASDPSPAARLRVMRRFDRIDALWKKQDELRERLYPRQQKEASKP